MLCYEDIAKQCPGRRKYFFKTNPLFYQCHDIKVGLQIPSLIQSFQSEAEYIRKGSDINIMIVRYQRLINPSRTMITKKRELNPIFNELQST